MLTTELFLQILHNINIAFSRWYMFLFRLLCACSISLRQLHVSLQSFVCFHNSCRFRLLFVLAFEAFTKTHTLLSCFCPFNERNTQKHKWQYGIVWNQHGSRDQLIKSSFIHVFCTIYGSVIHYHQVFIIFLLCLSVVCFGQFEEIQKENKIYFH